ncbi:MAG: lamin tail domain-containing protein [Treponema sp.]|nr:lamin tail domain-containing protein [Treponema sp.]
MREKLTVGSLALVSLALLAMVFVGCDNVSGGDIADISIFHNGQPAQASFDLWVYPHGEDGAQHSVQLSVRIIPGTAYYQNATWSSSSPEYATVSNGGLVTAVAAGTATITATTAAGRTASVAVNVRGFEPPTEPGDKSQHAGDLIILQAAAVQSTGGNAHRTFVELYNRSDATINLGGLSLQYAIGQGNTWNVIPLNGNIPAGHSFLILGAVAGQGSRLQLSDGDADMLLPDFQLNNRAFRLALMEGTMPLTVHNPSDMSHDGSVDLRTFMPATGSSDATVGEKTAAGLIDMLGVVNERTEDSDIIHGAKGAPAYRISNQTSIRRTSLDDATNNFNDFRGIDWQARGGAVADDQIPVFRPRNLAAGEWTPTFPEPNWQPPVSPSSPSPNAPLAERIIILQANRSGNNNGGGGGFPNSLVELFNLTEEPIDLAGYYLHIGAGTGTATAPATTWNYVIELTGKIPARSSFLVVSTTDTNPVFRADLPTADQSADFNFNVSANQWSVALMTHRSPFTDPASWPDAYHVDLLGAGNSTVSEAAFASTSQPQGPRRRALTDTNNNGADFHQVDFRGHWEGTARTPNNQLYTIWPRNSSAGQWEPITGYPARHPRVVTPSGVAPQHGIPGTVEQEACS